MSDELDRLASDEGEDEDVEAHRKPHGTGMTDDAADSDDSDDFEAHRKPHGTG